MGYFLLVRGWGRSVLGEGNSWTSDFWSKHFGTRNHGPVSQKRRSRVHSFGAILHILVVLGYWAILLGLLEVPAGF